VSNSRNVISRIPGLSWRASLVLPLAAGVVSMALAQDAGSPPRPAASAPTAAPSGQAAPQQLNIAPSALVILVRSVLIALDQANKTGNYSVLRDLGSPGFRLVNTPARLAEIFANQRKSNFDLSNVAILDPQITVAPHIESDGLAHFTGFFPATGGELRFEFALQLVDQRWQLFGLTTNFVPAGQDPAQTSSSAPTPPPAQAPAAKAASEEPKDAHKKRTAPKESKPEAKEPAQAPQ
jgi:hypothetical protein